MISKKRGQGLSTQAIILIILGVFVLAILIFGFTVGWSKLAPWISTENNINSLVTSCSVACNTQSVYDFCTQQRELKADADSLAVINQDVGSKGGFLESGSKKSCNEFLEYPKLGIQDCSNLCPK